MSGAIRPNPPATTTIATARPAHAERDAEIAAEAARLAKQAQEAKDAKEAKGVGDLPDLVVTQGGLTGFHMPPPPIEIPPASPPQDGAIAQAAVTLGQFGEAAVSIQAIAQVMQDANLQSKVSARLDRQSALQAEYVDQMNAARKTRDMGGFQFGMTMATSTLAIAGAAVSTVGTVKAANTRIEASNLTESMTDAASDLRLDALDDAAQASNLRASATRGVGAQDQATLNEMAAEFEQSAASKNLDAQQLDNAASRISLVAETAAKKTETFYNVAGTATTETGKIIGAVLQQQATEKEADRNELQAKATLERSRAEDDADFIHTYTDNVRSVQDKLSAIQQAQNDTNRAILQG